jgi:hypothetical protein
MPLGSSLIIFLLKVAEIKEGREEPGIREWTEGEREREREREKEREREN